MESQTDVTGAGAVQPARFGWNGLLFPDASS